MFFNSTKDWKQFLSLEDEERLNQILNKISKYRGAYKNAEDVKIAQLWCSVLEVAKQNRILQNKLSRIEEVLEGMFSRVREQERQREELARSLESF